MATYLVLNLIMATVVIVALKIITGRVAWNRHVALVLLVLFVTTAVFDSLIVASHIVDYDQGLITGVRIGAAPIEDFFYAFVAALLVPTVWEYSRKDRDAKN